MDELFNEYCKNGELDNIKKISLINCDLENGFRTACYNGHYDIVQYLVNLYKTGKYKPIYIHTFAEYGFAWACLKGHYDIVQYLVELHKQDTTYEPINIQVYNEEGFRWAYDNGHYNIVKYLMTLYKKHNYKPIKNYLMVFKKIDKYLL